VDYEAKISSKVIKSTLKDILDTPVSPELIPPKDGKISQKTEDIVGPYLLHDFYLYYAIKCGFKPSKIYFIAKSTFSGKFSNEELYKWLKNFYNRFFTQQFKRSCVPDGVKIGSVGFSPRGDFMMPSDACRKVWIDDLNNIES
jgi:NAD+ synthase (glutamine-hydrolysing)